jgi:hypothetical protein
MLWLCGVVLSWVSVLARTLALSLVSLVHNLCVLYFLHAFPRCICIYISLCIHPSFLCMHSQISKAAHGSSNFAQHFAVAFGPSSYGFTAASSSAACVEPPDKDTARPSNAQKSTKVQVSTSTAYHIQSSINRQCKWTAWPSLPQPISYNRQLSAFGGFGEATLTKGTRHGEALRDLRR